MFLALVAAMIADADGTDFFRSQRVYLEEQYREMSEFSANKQLMAGPDSEVSADFLAFHWRLCAQTEGGELAVSSTAAIEIIADAAMGQCLKWRTAYRDVVAAGAYKSGTRGREPDAIVADAERETRQAALSSVLNWRRK